MVETKRKIRLHFLAHLRFEPGFSLIQRSQPRTDPKSEVTHCIGNVVHHVQNPHSIVTWDFSYSTLNIVFSAAKIEIDWDRVRPSKDKLAH